MWKKIKISWLQRINWLRHGIEWLPLTYIDSFDYDTKKWNVRPLSFEERFDCFIAGLETAILGYVYTS